MKLETSIWCFFERARHNERKENLSTGPGLSMPTFLWRKSQTCLIYYQQERDCLSLLLTSHKYNTNTNGSRKIQTSKKNMHVLLSVQSLQPSRIVHLTVESEKWYFLLSNFALHKNLVFLCKSLWPWES